MSPPDGAGYPEYQDALCGAIDRLSEQVGWKKKNIRNQTADKIMNYIKENFCDSGISVKWISQELGYHENYISNLFKETYGENLSAFLEKLRMEKACALLGDPALSIRDIAEQVGYTSEPSFRRAFKRIYGMAPGEYRKGAAEGKEMPEP